MKMTTGLIAGSLIGMAGVTWALSDNKTRKRVAKDTKKLVQKASNMM